MKKIIILVVVLFCFKTLDAQVVKLVANPDSTAVGFDGEFGVEWNGSLYVSYQNTTGKRQLAKFNGTTTTLINNPDTTGSIYQYSKIIVFNNAVYFMYGTTYNDYQLAKYDGTSVALIPSLPNTFIDSYDNEFVIYKNELYILYRDLLNSYRGILLKYDGSILKSVFTTTSSGSIATNTTPFIYNNKLCFVFNDSLGQLNIVNYDGAATINISNPIAHPTGSINSETKMVLTYNGNIYLVGGAYASGNYLNYILKYNGSSISVVKADTSYSSNVSLAVCNNNLYYTTSTTTATKLVRVNDVNNTTPIANPDAGAGVGRYQITLYKNKLFFRYENVFEKKQSGIFDGTSISLKPNKNTVDDGVTGFALFNNNLYFGYINTNGTLQIGRYTDTGNIFYKNPDSLGKFGSFSSSYNNVLYVGYQNEKGKYQIAYLDSGAATINYTIMGKIVTPLKKGINKVVMNVTGTTIDSKFGDLNGIYTNTLETGNYVLKPTKNNDIKKNNGVSSIDVILTTNHILNKAKLKSPYKLIAADVNNNKTISNIDVILMKRLILGIDTTFTGNRLWAFVDSAYQFSDTTNPFPYKDSISFSNLTSNKTNQSFIGVKLGDVNYDWNPLVARGVANKPVELEYEIRSALKVRPDGKNGTDFQSDLIHIPITVKYFKDLTALQYTLNFNHKDYEFVAIENNKLGIEFNEKQATRNGNISFLWADAKGEEKSLEDGSVLFEIVLKPKQGIRNLELGIGGEPINNLQLTINNSITEIEAWDKDNLQHNIILTKQTTQQEPQTANTKQWTVSPNPNDGNIVITLSSNANKTVVFELSNAVGKTLYTQSVKAFEGNNLFHLNLNKKSKLTGGVYFVKVIGIEGESVKRIVVNGK